MFYCILSPVYVEVEEIDPEIGGPSYDAQDILCVEAPTYAKAKARFVKHFRAKCWGPGCSWEDDNPFVGLECAGVFATPACGWPVLWADNTVTPASYDENLPVIYECD